MARLERKPLVGHPSRSGIAASGGCAIAFGLPFLLMGTFVAVAASGFIEIDSAPQAPTSIVVGIGVLFAGVGLWMIGGGLRRTVAARRAAHARAEHPDEPWLWDYRWNQREVRTGGFGPVISGSLGVLFFGLFAAPFNWVGFTQGSVPFAIAAVVIDLLVLAAVGVVLYQLAQWIRYGKSALRFTTFPYFLGSSLDVILPGSRRLRGFSSLTFTLRCIEESFESQGKSNTVVCSGVYEDTQTLTQGSDASLEMDALPVSFRLPDGDYETRLSAHPPRYWELEVKADKPGVDFSAMFLLPVYARLGSAAAYAADERDTASAPPSSARTSTPRGNLKPTPRR